MRAREIILEYRRDKTAMALGDKLLQTLGNTRPEALPDALQGAHELVSMTQRPNMYYDRPVKFDVLGNLITVGTDTAPQILQQLKQKIIEAILSTLEAQDPTTTKEYTQWLARTWATANGQAKIEDMNRNGLLTVYTLGKRRRLISPEHADINKFKTYAEFENAILNNYDLERLGGEASKQQANRGNAVTVYDDNYCRVIQPKDTEAACYYGQGTRWCTAATRGNNYFDTYNSQGPMYIILPKQPKYDGEKYQLHFPSAQYMDEQDDSVDLGKLLTGRFPTLREFFVEREPELADSVAFAPDDTLVQLGRIIGERIEEAAWEEISDWEANDSYYHAWQAEQARERGYTDEDDEIDWDRVHEDDELNDYIEYNDEARKFMQDIDKIRTPSGSEIKQWASDWVESGYAAVATPGITDLPEIYQHMISQEISNSGLEEFVDKHLLVTPASRSLNYPMKRINVIGNVGKWNITTIYDK
jgi:serine protease inhibitor ecotin